MCGNVPVGFQPGTATWACASGGRMGTLLGSSCPQQESINSLSNAAYRFLPNASMVVDWSKIEVDPEHTRRTQIKSRKLPKQRTCNRYSTCACNTECASCIVWNIQISHAQRVCALTSDRWCIKRRESWEIAALFCPFFCPIFRHFIFSEDWHSTSNSISANPNIDVRPPKSMAKPHVLGLPTQMLGARQKSPEIARTSV